MSQVMPSAGAHVVVTSQATHEQQSARGRAARRTAAPSRGVTASGRDTGRCIAQCVSVTAADVCLYGLNIIMPLMSAELLKFPNLCLQYFKTITFVCEIYPEKV